MEITELRANEIMLEIVHPKTEQPLGITVPLRSLEDEEMKKLSRKLQNDRIGLSKRGKVFTAEQIEENENLILFTAMTGWDWHKDANGEQALFHGEKPAFTKEKVYQVFNELPWFKAQVMDGAGDTKAFFQ
jgi:hypothetical protein